MSDLRALVEESEIRHFHLFCGAGGGAKGFNRGRAEVGNLRGKFRCIGGVDVDPAALRDFERLAGAKGTCLDLFDRQQYEDFHGRKPPADWREVGPDDIRRAAGGEFPNIVFLSSPCKGFSGLLSETKSKGAKYQALNRLTLRGVWLMLEAFAGNLPELIIFENVPRIATRGRWLLDQIEALYAHFGYAFAETTHDCGEIGWLAESRKRFLLVARHMEKVPPFLYEPPKHPLRAVGEILGRMPMPEDPRGGPMHKLPRLHWKTWVRLAFVEAGSDWRSLNKLRVVDGQLADYLVVPDSRADFLGVNRWSDPSGAVSGRGGPTNGAYSVADPRCLDGHHHGVFGVNPWNEHSGAVTGHARPVTGPFSVADLRYSGADYHQYGVLEWAKPAGAVSGQSAPGGGVYSVADPRFQGAADYHTNISRVTAWDKAARTVTGANHTAGGAPSVADPRLPMNRTFRVVRIHDLEANSRLGAAVRSESGRNRPESAAPREMQGGMAGHQRKNSEAKRPPVPVRGDVGRRDESIPAAGSSSDRALDLSRPKTGGDGRAASERQLLRPSLGEPGLGNAEGEYGRQASTPDDVRGRTPLPGQADGSPSQRDQSVGAESRGNRSEVQPAPHVRIEHSSPDHLEAHRVGDPGIGSGRSGHLGVVGWNEPSGTVSGESLPSNGGFAVADPRPSMGGRAFGKFGVAGWDGSTGTVIGGDDSGAYAVADPRAMSRERGDNYLTGGHYGVIPWGEPAGAVPSAACHDNGPWSVADPRVAEPVPVCPICCAAIIEAGLAVAGEVCQGCRPPWRMPEPSDRLVCVIRALDNTWHRPFTTLELAALQSLVDPEDLFDGEWDLDGTSDSAKRERVGNAVPPRAAQAIADLMGETILRARAGETFMLSALPVWVKPVAIALSVRTEK